MKTANLKKCFYILFPVLILIVSCQKEIDPTDPDQIPEGVKDSTLLIKSIRLNSVDPQSGLADDDSIKEDYFYDTVNRKIILTIDHAASHPDYFPFVGIEHQYDANGLLTNVTHKYRDGFVLDDDLLVSVKMDYDADKVLQKIAISYFNGEVRTILFKKTALSSGKYELKWNQPRFDPFTISEKNTTHIRSIFGKEGKCLWTEYAYKVSVGSGDEDYEEVIITDSLIYDAMGNVSKILVNIVDTANQKNETFVGCEFLARHSKGDQLYNQQQVLLNGIANIPFGEDLVRGSISGILSYFPDGYEPKQYHKYPFQTAKVYNSQTKQYDSFTAVSEFDSKDRLVKFRGFLNDYQLFPYLYEITYHK